MKKLGVDEVLQILEKSEKPFNDMVDWHIAAFQEQDQKKQKLYHAIYDIKRKAYEEQMKILFEKYE